VTCAWPSEYRDLLEWQWANIVVPYWREQAAFAAAQGVRLCFEMHPGFVVYNPETLLRLREVAGEAVGANFDPSHLYWQGIDPTVAVKTLGTAGALFHVHAKDTYIDPDNTARNGVLDTKPLADARQRSWLFRTVGHGHGQLHWRQLIGAMRAVGYDDVLSIEHEDLLASTDEGFAAAVRFLKDCIWREPPAQAWWI
jgi:sugar phosphate isomerase/epimerase